MTTVAASSRRAFLGRAAAALLGCVAGRSAAQEQVATPTIQEGLARAMTEAPLELRFRGTTEEECRRWQKEFGDRLRQLLGPHRPPAKWKTHVRGAVDLAD